MSKITLKNIGQFIEGNLNVILSSLGGKPLYYREQIIYRASKCKDCHNQGHCKMCGCDLPGKHHVRKSCNPDRFPDLMSEKEWEQFKKDNDIEIYL